MFPYRNETSLFLRYRRRLQNKWNKKVTHCHCQSSVATILGNKCKEPSNFQRKGKSNINFLKSNDRWHVGWGNLKYHDGRYLALEISRAPTRHFVRALRCYVKQWQWPGPQSPDDTHCVYRAMFYSGDVRPLVWHSLNINTTQTPASSNIHEVKKTSQTIFSWSCENKQDLNLSP